jgi:Flp pilus assembly protein TadD
MAFLPALQNGFVNFDDNVYVYENAALSSLDWAFIKNSFFGFYYLNWHPLTMISYAVDYRLWGLDPFGFHLTNIVFHSVNTFLAGVLACRLLDAEGSPRKPMFSFTFVAVSALLFGLHPLHVESVAWISERKDVLSGFFFLLALISYVRYASSSGKRRLHYCASLLFFLLALMSKPMAVTLPVVLLILDYYPLKRRPFKTAILEKVPFGILALFSAVMTLAAQTTASAFTSSLWERALVSMRAYVFYLEKLALPLDLSPFYPIFPKPELASPEYLMAPLVLLGLAFICFIKRRSRAYTAAYAFFLVTLLPVIGMVQISSHLAADRYMYLPSLAPFMLAGIGAASLAVSNGRLKAVTASAVVLFALPAFASIRQIDVWKDSVSLWSRVIEKYPYVYLAYNNRAVAHTQQGRYTEAISDLEKSIEMAPDFMPAYINLADAHKKAGRKDLAADVYGSALLFNGNNPEVLFERGLTYYNMGEFAKAAEDFTAVLSSGFHVESLIYRAAASMKLGDATSAAEDLSAALEADPQNALAHYGMAEVYHKMRNMERASYHIGRAKALGNR